LSEPIVYIEDLGSSNGTWVNGRRIESTPYRQVLKHGDEISLGAQGELDDHDVRYIYRSVGKEGELLEEVGGIFQKYTFVDTLGTGSFAEVKKAVEIRTGAVYAVKVSGDV
jgi:ser/thr/tyr protein kinase RAD53